MSEETHETPILDELPYQGNWQQLGSGKDARGAYDIFSLNGTTVYVKQPVVEVASVEPPPAPPETPVAPEATEPAGAPTVIHDESKGNN